MKIIVITAAALLAITGCGGPSGGPFTSAGPQPLSCMRHQPTAPGADYKDPAKQNMAAGFEVLRYYTANGDRPYCDHKGPTDNDRAWARVYLRLGADPALVRGVIPHS